MKVSNYFNLLKNKQIKSYYMLCMVFICSLVIDARGNCCLSTPIKYDFPVGLVNPVGQAAAFSPDGSLLAVTACSSASYQPAEVILFQLAGNALNRGTVIERNAIQSVPLQSIAFSPDGLLLATGNYRTMGLPGGLTLYTVAGNTLVEGPSYAGSNGFDFSVAAFSPDGTLLALSNSDSISLFTVNSNGTLSGETLYSMPSGSGGARAMAFSPDGLYLATGNDSSDVTLFTVIGSTLSQGVSYALPTGVINPNSLSFSSDSSLLAVGCYVGGVAVFTVASGTLAAGTAYPMPDDAQLTSVAFSSDNAFLIAACVSAFTNNITVFQVGTGGLLSGATPYSLPMGSVGPRSLALLPNSSLVATVNDFSDVSLFTLSNGTVATKASYPLPTPSAGPSAVTISPDGSLLATANASNDIMLCTLTNGTISDSKSYPLPTGIRRPLSLAFSPDGTLLATANSYYQGNAVALFTVENGGTLSTSSLYPSSGTCSLAFSPDGSLLAVANCANGVTLFTVNSDGTLSGGTNYSSPEYANVGTTSVAFSPDGSLLAVGSGMGIILFSVIGNTLNGGRLYNFTGSTMYIPSLVFSPDGSRLVIPRYVLKVKNNALSILSSHPQGLDTSFSWPQALQFSPDGSLFAFAGEGLMLFNVIGGSLSNGVNYNSLNQDSNYTDGSQSYRQAVSVAFSPDGTFLATANRGVSGISLFPLDCSSSCPISSASFTRPHDSLLRMLYVIRIILGDL